MPRYVINVAYNGERLFSTSRTSCPTKAHVQALLVLFRDTFPDTDNYQTTVFEINSKATELHPDSLDPVPVLVNTVHIGG